jgi:Holliday junction resolvase RusA-like endonuclease
MTVEIEFPFEFVVIGAARSQQASADSKEAWRAHIQESARLHLPEGNWATGETVFVTIYYFPDTEMDGDIDNIVKPILDAMSGPIYIDDNQVERIVVQKFEPRSLGRIVVFSEPTTMLAAAIEAIGPRDYIRPASR